MFKLVLFFCARILVRVEQYKIALIAFFVVVGLTATATGVYKIYNQIDPNGYSLSSSNFAFSCREKGDECSCDLSKNDLKIIEVTTRNNQPPFTMKLDQEYFDPRFNVPPKSRDLLLHIWGDSFRPWPHNIAPVSQYGPRVNMLITAYGDNKTPGPIILKDRLLRQGNLASGRSVLNNGWFFSEGEEIYNLTKLNYTVEKATSFHRNDFYISRDSNDNLSTIITCTPDPPVGGAVYSRCRQIFSNRLADISLTYSRNFLPQWFSLEHKAKKLFTCATGGKEDTSE